MGIPLLLLLLLLSSASLSHAQVSAQNQFKFVNEGEFGPFITEYDASYRTTSLFSSPFQLMWYNTTPGLFYVGLRMGLQRSESLFRWVWDANRGRPVGEGATLAFGRDGNLVLAEADGRVVWSTGTADKGAVGIKILPVGNIVIYDKQGRFLWQSFDHPTDTLLVGQSLHVGGADKLVSRRSAADNSDGIYSFVLEPTKLNFYVASSQKRVRYYRMSLTFPGSGRVTNATVSVDPVDDGAAYSVGLSTNIGGTSISTRPKYNATLSILRLQIDGNLVFYTYYDPVDYRAWQRTFSFFSLDRDPPTCFLPAKCGSLGLCEDEMCVACPTSGGLFGWSKRCKPPALGAPCKTGGGAAGYLKVVGVEHFIPQYNKGLGNLKVEQCSSRCTGDCNCFGFLYHEESSQCWLAPVLGSLATSTNTSHVAYIKTFK